MNSCSQCGQAQEDLSSRCHHCGSLNLKIDDILANLPLIASLDNEAFEILMDDANRNITFVTTGIITAD